MSFRRIAIGILILAFLIAGYWMARIDPPEPAIAPIATPTHVVDAVVEVPDYCVRVVNAQSGTPISGVALQIRSRGRVLPSPSTNLSGMVTWVSEDEQLAVDFLAPGFAFHTQVLKRSPDCQDVALEPVFAVTFGALDESGNRVERFHYTVAPIREGGDYGEPVRIGSSIGIDGDLVVEGLTTGEFRIQMIADDSVDFPKAGYLDFAVGDSSTLDHFLVVLRETTILSGVVLDHDGITPLSGVRISLHGLRQVDASSARFGLGSVLTTGDDGLFQLSAVEVGEGMIVASHPVAGVVRMPVVVSSGRDAEPLILTLEPRGVVRGRVASRDGGALAGIAVQIVPAHGMVEPVGVSPVSLTNELGVFELGAMDPGLYAVHLDNERIDGIAFGLEMEFVSVGAGEEVVLNLQYP